MTARMYCFDERGLPTDPGMVAALWLALAAEFDGLAEDDLLLAPQAGRRVHCVGLAEGPLDDATLGLIQVGGATATAPVMNLPDGDREVTVTDTSSHPFLRVALVPAGTRAARIALSDDDLLDRDMLRVSIVDLETTLTGTVSTDPAQARESTKVRVAPTAGGPALLASTDEIVESMRAATAAGGRADLIATLGTFDGGIGPLPAPPALPDIAPGPFEDASIAPLHGAEGPEEDGWSPTMRAVLRFSFPTEFLGAWVRVLPLGFDLDRGERTALVGGSGVVANRADGPAALVVVTLPPGPSRRDVRVSFDVEIITAGGRYVASAVGFDRPERPLPGAAGGPAPVVLPASGTASGLYVCETGGTALVSGFSAVVERGGEFVAIDDSAVPGSAFPGSIAASLRATDRVVFSSPVWSGEATGDGLERLCLSPISPILRHRRRGGFLQVAEASGTLPAHDDRGVVLSTAAGASGVSVVSGGHLLATTHQIVGPSGGSAGEPAEAETHVAGILLSGQAAALGHEAALASGHADTIGLLTDAISATPAPTPTGQTKWAAVLRTGVRHVEGERELDIADAVSAYPFDGTHSERRNWLGRALTLRDGDLPTASGIDQEAAFDRAASRRVLAASEGFSEAVPALRKAIAGAQRFVYIEAPSLTAGTISGGGSEIDIVGLLTQRLEENAALHALICVPQRSGAAFPHLRRFRTILQTRVAAGLHDAQSLKRRGDRPVSAPTIEERAVIFSPLGSGRRPLDIASTTVIVDDVVCFVGSTDLSRRGLTFDASLLVGVTDDVVADGVSPDIRAFRTRLIADRIGEPADAIARDGRIVTAMVGEMLAQDVTRTVGVPLPPLNDIRRGIPSDSEQPSADLTILQQFLDPDGRAGESPDIGSYLAGLLTAVTTGSLTDDSSRPTTCA